MPQASITINAVPGSDTDLPINTLVQLDNQNIGGELSYLWEILDQPPGTVDVLSSAVLQNPTFTPKKEGTYLLKLTVNATLVTEQTQTVVAAVVQLKTLERIPAAGEVLEADTADGWATAMGALLRRIDALLSDPGVLVGVNASGGVIVRGDVVRCTANSTIKAGLPGQEVVPGFTKALATTLGQVDELLCVTEGTPSGGSSVAIGALMKVRYIGRFTGVVGGPPASGDPVYVSDTGTLALTPGTVSRQVGSAINAANPFDVWFTGVGAQDVTVTPIDRRYVVHGPLGTLPNGVRVDGTNATGITTPFRVKAGDAATVALQVQGFAAGADLQQWLDSTATVLASITNAGYLTFASAGQRVAWPGGVHVTSSSPTALNAVLGSGHGLFVENAGAFTQLLVNASGGAGLLSLRNYGGATGYQILGTGANPLTFATDSVDRWQITATGALASVGGPRAIQSVLDPVSAQDASTKAYNDLFLKVGADPSYVADLTNGLFFAGRTGDSGNGGRVRAFIKKVVSGNFQASEFWITCNAMYNTGAGNWTKDTGTGPSFAFVVAIGRDPVASFYRGVTQHLMTVAASPFTDSAWQATDLQNVSTSQAGVGTIGIMAPITMPITAGGGGWTADGTITPQYWKDPFGRAHFSGGVNTTNATQQIFTLPQAYWPAFDRRFVLATLGGPGTEAAIFISSATGAVTIASPAVTTCFLDGVSFR